MVVSLQHFRQTKKPNGAKRAAEKELIENKLEVKISVVQEKK